MLATYLQNLIERPSISPFDAGCQNYMQQVLENFGFRCQRFDKNQVSNLYAEIGHSGKRLIFAGHTDVVEPGCLDNWKFPPFELTSHDGKWYGRGVADMKGALAAMLMLAKHWSEHQKPGLLGFLITSGEEGQDYLDGTPHVMQELTHQNTVIDYCIVGEPSSTNKTGDTIKNGRRGSLSCSCTIIGKQGHVAYPMLAENALHKALPFLTALSSKTWDEGNSFFPPSSLQMTNIQLPTSAKNVIPGSVNIDFNIRFNNEHSSKSIKNEIVGLAKNFELTPSFAWELSGEPFITHPGTLVNIVKDVIFNQQGYHCELSTSGGTSDARFIAPYNIEVIELGLPNGSIHQANEHIQQIDLQQLIEMYIGISEKLLG